MRSAPRAPGPLADLALGRSLWAVVGAASAGLALAWRFLPLPAGAVVAAYAAAIALLVGGAVVRALGRAYVAEGSPFAAVARPEASAPAARPKELEAIERAVAAGTATASDAHLWLRPLVRALLVPGLTSADEEHGPGRAAREARRDGALAGREGTLGPALWELARPARPRPGRIDAPGIALEALERIVEELEARRDDP